MSPGLYFSYILFKTLYHISQYLLLSHKGKSFCVLCFTSYNPFFPQLFLLHETLKLSGYFTYFHVIETARHTSFQVPACVRIRLMQSGNACLATLQLPRCISHMSLRKQLMSNVVLCNASSPIGSHTFHYTLMLDQNPCSPTLL